MVTATVRCMHADDSVAATNDGTLLYVVLAECDTVMGLGCEVCYAAEVVVDLPLHSIC